MRAVGAFAVEEMTVWLEEEGTGITQVTFASDRGATRTELDREGDSCASLDIRISADGERNITVLHDMGSEDAVQVLDEVGEALTALAYKLHSIHEAADA